MVLEVVTIETPEIGDRSYLLHDGRHGLVVDPQRDVERVLAAAEATGVAITHVAETHIHNDYVSGGRELAAVTGAEYLVAAAEVVELVRTPISPGESFPVGTLSVEAIATPGHTPHHLAYLVTAPGGPAVVCTGGSLLYGAVGRTDLVDPSRTAELAAAQYRSIRALADHLVERLAGHAAGDPADGSAGHAAHDPAGRCPDGSAGSAGYPADEASILPTHGFGSFCAGGAPASRRSGTLADERRENPALTEDDESRFVADLLARLTAYPRYYARMGPLNRVGAGPMPPPVKLLDPAELGGQLAAGRLLVDLRHRRAYAARHLVGTLDFELAQPFTTYVGWVLPPEDDLYLIGADEAELDQALRFLARIGREVAGGFAGETSALAAAGSVALGSFPAASFADLAAAQAAGERPVVLDVRRDDEWDAGHLEGAVHCFVADLPDRLDELPEDRLWVHCASGYRAGVAASLLARRARQVVLVDDEWANALGCGLAIVSGPSETFRPPVPGLAAPR